MNTPPESKKPKTEEEKLTFEQAYARLEEVARILERESVSLKESFDLYAEGERLLRLCNTMLDSAEQKLKIIQETAEGYTIQEEVIGK